MQTDDKHSFLAVYTEEDISASYISFENISEIYIDEKKSKSRYRYKRNRYYKFPRSNFNKAHTIKTN